MSAPCVTCGAPVGEMHPDLRKAKERLGFPLTPAKRCSNCVWASLIRLADSPDEEEAPPSPSVAAEEKTK